MTDNNIMLSTKEAGEIINEKVKPLQPREVLLADACGLLLWKDIIAPIDIPSFHQSAVDGYAFAFEDWKTKGKLLLAETVPAGHPEKMHLLPGTAMRIFTGAPVPERADTVVMQEKTTLMDDSLTITDDTLSPGSNIRPKGSEILKNAPSLPAGIQITPAAIGFLAGMGIDRLIAIPHPSIAIILTGKELTSPGKPLSHGQVYESNGVALQAALRQQGFNEITIMRSDDDPNQLSRLLHEALKKNDLILITGGVSVGDFDFTIRAAADCGVEQWFHKLKQKPGKPLYLGGQGQKTVFGLPGNPASVLTCFYEYVLPALGIMTGRKPGLISKKARLLNGYTKKGFFRHFLKGYTENDTVSILEGQESYKMQSFALANCLVVLEEDKQVFMPGETVEIHLLPV